jgi:hypothetical protein
MSQFPDPLFIVDLNKAVKGFFLCGHGSDE